MKIECIVFICLLMFYGEFVIYGFCEIVSGQEYVVFSMGELMGDELLLVWVYFECMMGEVFGLLCCDC